VAKSPANVTIGRADRKARMAIFLKDISCAPLWFMTSVAEDILIHLAGPLDGSLQYIAQPNWNKYNYIAI
jgi:hypothetical protein